MGYLKINNAPLLRETVIISSISAVLFSGAYVWTLNIAMIQPPILLLVGGVLIIVGAAVLAAGLSRRKYGSLYIDVENKIVKLNGEVAPWSAVDFFTPHLYAAPRLYGISRQAITIGVGKNNTFTISDNMALLLGYKGNADDQLDALHQLMYGSSVTEGDLERFENWFERAKLISVPPAEELDAG